MEKKSEYATKPFDTQAMETVFTEIAIGLQYDNVPCSDKDYASIINAATLLVKYAMQYRQNSLQK